MLTDLMTQSITQMQQLFSTKVTYIIWTAWHTPYAKIGKRSCLSGLATVATSALGAAVSTGAASVGIVSCAQMIRTVRS